MVDPLLAPHSDAFSGALFQCHLVQGSTGTTAVVAAGGRWGWLGAVTGLLCFAGFDRFTRLQQRATTTPSPLPAGMTHC